MDPVKIKRALRCCSQSPLCSFNDKDYFYCIHGYDKFRDKALLRDALTLITFYETKIELLKAQIAVYEGWVNK